jgi:hypothetical protein
MGAKLPKGVSVINFNIIEELEKFVAGKKTRVDAETLLHITAGRYLENYQDSQKRAARIRRAQRSRVGNLIAFPRTAGL